MVHLTMIRRGRFPTCRPTVVPMRRLSRLPDWLIGLVFAIVVVSVLFAVFGVGDDPTVGSWVLVTGS